MASKKQPSQPGKERLRMLVIRTLPAWLVLCALLTLIAPNLQNVIEHYTAISGYTDERRIERQIAPLFTLQVDHWHDDILRWAETYSLDPNLVATVIQIESCGDPGVVSPAGAQGLMQVMPQHFDAEQNPLDPETNVRRGMDILTECLYSPYNSSYDVGLAVACYNGGPSVLVNAWDYWPQQSRDYYIWATNIYADAQANLDTSETLDQWLLAGGASLCAGARQTLGLTPTP